MLVCGLRWLLAIGASCVARLIFSRPRMSPQRRKRTFRIRLGLGWARGLSLLLAHLYEICSWHNSVDVSNQVCVAPGGSSEPTAPFISQLRDPSSACGTVEMRKPAKCGDGSSRVLLLLFACPVADGGGGVVYSTGSTPATDDMPHVCGENAASTHAATPVSSEGENAPLVGDDEARRGMQPPDSRSILKGPYDIVLGGPKCLSKTSVKTSQPSSGRNAVEPRQTSLRCWK